MQEKNLKEVLKYIRGLKKEINRGLEIDYSIDADPYDNIARMKIAEKIEKFILKMEINKDIKKRKEGKILKVYGFPQNNEYVPAIRVTGKWLNYFGFKFDDKIILTAEENKITIQKIINKRKEGDKDG